MHELTATQRILDAALERGGAGDGQRVRAVRLQLGALSGLTEDSIRFYWELLTPGTAAEGSRLDVVPIAGRVLCRTCGAEGEVLDAYPMCSACAGVDLTVLAGDACAIESVEAGVPMATTGAQSGGASEPREVTIVET